MHSPMTRESSLRSPAFRGFLFASSRHARTPVKSTASACARTHEKIHAAIKSQVAERCASAICPARASFCCRTLRGNCKRDQRYIIYRFQRARESEFSKRCLVAREECACMHEVLAFRKTCNTVRDFRFSIVTFRNQATFDLLSRFYSIMRCARVVSFYFRT